MTDSAPSTNGRRIDAVIFDMDGVVTDTAAAHAAAWRALFDEFLAVHAQRTDIPFVPFDPVTDYRAYVDGKPRYDGVSSFLASRDIALPFGDPQDGPDTETVCGLGNRKDALFHAWLERHTPHVYASTVELLKILRANGVGTGLFTASRNAGTVLVAAGVGHLFDARVDGNDAARLGLAGKPDPATLLEAAARLGSDPQHVAVVEDAAAGVRAGAAGGFGFVIGIDRDDYGELLSASGADIVVHDLAELDFDRRTGFSLRLLDALPTVWEQRDAIATRLRGKALAVFLDYDGTLTPIVEDYTKAFLADDMRAAIRALAASHTVAIVSGRDLADLQALVGLDNVVYSGSHGFEIAAPGRDDVTLEMGLEFLDALDTAETRLRADIAAIAGAAVERKRFAIAVHYRRVADEADVAVMERVVDAAVDADRRLHKTYGKKVFQLQPRLSWDKGGAIGWLLARLDLDRPDIVPVYVGDDLTDEDAFRTLAGRGLAIAVGDESRPTAADCRIDGPGETKKLLAFLVEATSGDMA